MLGSSSSVCATSAWWWDEPVVLPTFSSPLVAEPPLPFPLSLLGALQMTQSGREETAQRYPQGNHAADGDSLYQQD